MAQASTIVPFDIVQRFPRAQVIQSIIDLKSGITGVSKSNTKLDEELLIRVNQDDEEMGGMHVPSM